MSEVLVEKRSTAAWLILNRPEKRNALSSGMVTALDAALTKALNDESVRSIVLTGAGPGFCAGADLKASGPVARQDPSGERNPFALLLQRFQHAEKPVIAAINGPAFGGGLGLVAVADIAVAASGATFSFSEVRLGLLPAMISVVVLPKVGAHHARRLFLTGRRFSAEEAIGYNLVHRVVESEELENAVAAEAADIAKGGPQAVAESKRLIREIPLLSEDDAFDRASAWIAERAASEEAREGMAAFAEKRSPAWRSQE